MCYSAATYVPEYHHSTRACDQISELVHCLRTHLSPHTLTPSVPPHLAGPLRNIIVQLARLPLVNSYVRTPPVIWKMGWMPSPSGDMRTSLPPLPVDFLQERDVLREFIFRVNVLGQSPPNYTTYWALICLICLSLIYLLIVIHSHNLFIFFVLFILFFK